MALKFLNKKGWHTGSLRNIENVWKAEQKHAAEEKKLDELRKQIQEERERTEFRLLQEQAGLVPKQERLDFLYDSGLSVGKSDGGGGGAAASGSGFKALEQPSSSATASTKQQQQPGALFEDKPHSAGDAWRKLHSDPLLLIRQREQEALARVKNNPVKMALIRKSAEEKKHKHKSRDKKDRKKKHRKHSSSRQQQPSDSDYSSSEGESPRKSKTHKTSHYDKPSDNDKNRYKDHSKYKYREPSPGDSVKRNHDRSKHQNYPSQGDKRGRESDSNSFVATKPSDSHYSKRRNAAPNLSEEELGARLREMQANAKLHEEHRWKRLRKAEENDAREAARDGISRGNNFLDAAQKSVYGAEKGGSSTIEERVRRRTYYSQGRSEAGEGNAFRR